MKAKRTIYYSDLLNDDFAGTNIKSVSLEKDFIFVNHHPLWRLASFFLYYFFAAPLVYLFCKLFLGLRIKNRKALKKVKMQGLFIYGNHTGFYDAFTHNVLCFPRRAHVISNRDCVSIKGLRQIVLMLGAIPIPEGTGNMKKMIAAVEYRYQQKRPITIYPEAHIWPYYTKLRPFSSTSFRYPVKLNAPSYAMVATYRKRLLFGKHRAPALTLHLSEPIYPNNKLKPKEAQIELRNQIYEWMEDVLKKNNNYQHIHYLYQPK